MPCREEAWEEALKKLKNWKAPGPDGLPGFWYKAFILMATNAELLLWKVLDGEVEMPGWLVRGRTVMIPKPGGT